MAPRKTCVFCGQRTPKLTIEDALPKWLLAYWPQHEIAGDVRNVFQSLDTGAVTERLAPLNVAAPIVCRQCNTGWMSDIQTRAAKYLKPMVSGRTTLLDSSAQRWVATWAFMTACTSEFALGPRSIPDTKLRELYRLRTQPPRGTQLWVGHYVSNRPDDMRLMTLFTTPLDVKAKPDHPVTRGAKAYAATIQIRHLVIQFFGHNMNVPSFSIIKGEAAALFLDIWPPARRPLSWPGRWHMDDIGLERVALGFVRNPYITV